MIQAERILRAEVPIWDNQSTEVPVYELQETGKPDMEKPVQDNLILLIIHIIKYEL